MSSRDIWFLVVCFWAITGNVLFVEQIRNGEQDDGPYMKAGFAVRDWFLAQMLPEPEVDFE